MAALKHKKSRNGRTTQKRRARESSGFAVQGGVLALLVFLVHAIGLFYRIPLTNRIGDEGNTYYSVAYSIYTCFLVLTGFHLPAAVSKLVAARAGRGQYRNTRQVMKGALLWGLLSSLLLGGLLYLSADLLARVWMLEPRAAVALRIFAPALPIAALLGVFRGYFQGMGTNVPTVISQFLEQAVFLAVLLFGGTAMQTYGSKVGALLKDTSYGPAYGAAGAALAAVIGGGVSLLFLLFLYVVLSRTLKGAERKARRESMQKVVRVLLLTMAPLVFASAVMGIGALAEQGIFHQLMAHAGKSAEKTVQWGVYTGKSQVIANIPIAMTMAFCTSLVPSLTRSFEARSTNLLREKSTTALRLVVLLALPFTLGLAVLADPLMDALFLTGDHEMAVRLLQASCVTILFSCLHLVLAAILQGMNKMRLPARNALFAMLVRLVLLYVLLQFLDLEIYAVVCANLIFSFVLCMLHIRSIRKYVQFRIDWGHVFLVPFLASAIMAAICGLLSFGLSKTPLGAHWILLICLPVGFLLYSFLVLFLHGVSEEELAEVPGGYLLIRLAQALRLL